MARRELVARLVMEARLAMVAWLVMGTNIDICIESSFMNPLLTCWPDKTPAPMSMASLKAEKAEKVELNMPWALELPSGNVTPKP